MAPSHTSGSTLSLHGAPNTTQHEQDESSLARAAIIVRLNSRVIRDLQQCAQGGKALQLLGGKTPKIRYGAKLLELNVRPETFRHEIYETDHSNNQLGFAAFVSHHAEAKPPAEKKVQEDGAGAEAALEALKQSLASMAKDKEERKTTISGLVDAGAKSSRYLQPSARPVSLSQRSASSSSTPRPIAPTSAPSDPHTQAGEKGMRFALVHLLAIRPLPEEAIHQKTHIPKSQLSSILPKIADKEGLTWDLSNKAYKELDPWSFKYTPDQRKLAIDHAIRAFDRARIPPKDDKTWQILLPKEDRNKGKILSRLHLTAERMDPAGTPGLAPTPLHASAAATPKLGSTGTPRGANGATATGRSAAGISIEKRLKEAKKKGAMEKKKLEKEAAAAASDREAKPRNVTTKRPIPPKKVTSKIKSDEVVHSSDDEEEGEVKEDIKPKKDDVLKKEPPKSVAKPRPTVAERRESSASEAAAVTKDIKAKAKPKPSDKLVMNGVSRKDNAISKTKADASLQPKPASLPKKPETALTAKTTTKAKDSPIQNPIKGASTTQRPNISPRRLTDTKPKVPSPLGASPPRNASDHIGKSTKQPPKSTITNITKLVRPAPKSSETLSFFGGVKPGSQSKIITKKRLLGSDTDSAEPPRKAVKSIISTTAKAPSSAPSKPSMLNGISKPSVIKAPPTPLVASTDKSLKRKANDLSSGIHDHAALPSSKHRKTDSGSTHSHAATTSSVASLTTAPTVSPHSSPVGSDFSDDNLAGILNDDYDGGPLTWEQTRAAAETFRSKLYPEYLQLYRRIEQTPNNKVAKEDTVRLWQLHNRLEAVKRRIEVACRDGNNVVEI